MYVWIAVVYWFPGLGIKLFMLHLNTCKWAIISLAHSQVPMATGTFPGTYGNCTSERLSGFKPLPASPPRAKPHLMALWFGLCWVLRCLLDTGWQGSGKTAVKVKGRHRETGAVLCYLAFRPTPIVTIERGYRVVLLCPNLHKISSEILQWSNFSI